jgi:cytochrome c-type biogenesis protein CcmE
MNKFVKQKIKIFSFLSLCILSGICLILYILDDKITFFYTPSELENTQHNNKEIRLGGLVKSGSIEHVSINQISFIIIDDKSQISVKYKGAVPQLFRDGQGVIVTGKLHENEFIARQLLTKHDEKYEPPKK